MLSNVAVKALTARRRGNHHQVQPFAPPRYTSRVTARQHDSQLMFWSPVGAAEPPELAGFGRTQDRPGTATRQNLPDLPDPRDFGDLPDPPDLLDPTGPIGAEFPTGVISPHLLPLDLTTINPLALDDKPRLTAASCMCWGASQAHEHNRSNLRLRRTADRRTLHSDLQSATPTTPSCSPKLSQSTTPMTPSCSLELPASLLERPSSAIFSLPTHVR